MVCSHQLGLPVNMHPRNVKLRSDETVAAAYSSQWMSDLAKKQEGAAAIIGFKRSHSKSERNTCPQKDHTRVLTEYSDRDDWYIGCQILGTQSGRALFDTGKCTQPNR